MSTRAASPSSPASAGGRQRRARPSSSASRAHVAEAQRQQQQQQAASAAAGAASGERPPSPDELRFLRLLAELRVQLGPQFDAASHPGYSRDGAVAALRAIIGNSTVTASRAGGFRGNWPAPYQVRVGAVLHSVVAAGNAALVTEVLAAQATQRHAWLIQARQFANSQLNVREDPYVRAHYGPDLPDVRDAGLGMDFIRSDAFAGARAGYVFHRGEAGLGYYRRESSARRDPSL